MIKKLPLVRRRAAEIVRSLLSEGYTLVSQSNACEICVLRHKMNGNRVVVKCGAIGVYVFKNGLLKKIELM